MVINIFTGGKGGIGKTLFSLCTAAYYLKEVKNAKLNLIDLNSNNPDFFKIMYGAKLNDKVKDQKGFVVKDIRKQTFDTKIICRKKLFKLPEDGNVGIWQDLNHIANLSKGKDILIVDTNMNIASLCFLDHLSDTKKIQKVLANPKITKIRIWLIWSFNLLAEIGEYDRLIHEKVIKSFEEISEEKFIEKEDLVHVINPFKYFADDEIGTITNFVKKLKQNYKKDVEIDLGEDSALFTSGGISFHNLLLHFINVYQTNRRGTGGLMRELLKQIHSTHKMLPTNVCFIPFYSDRHNIKNYIENLSAEPPDDIDSIVKPIDRIYRHMTQHLKRIDNRPPAAP